ncbi:MAG TPA: hypothetical protein VH724_15565 [Candidatus Angelobacter sp.]|jgi:hypothetical protein|nr:hypothetical protein [Candidatus Angelobacter sp.]
MRPGHTRFFVGYKKHTLRLWMRSYQPAVLLVPLVSWATPAHVPEGYLLKPSIRQCQQRLSWRPDMVVGDLGYIHQQTKKEIRQQWQVAVVTKLKSDMRIIEPFDAWDQMSCQQGQTLQWLGYDAEDSLHWFGVPLGESLCRYCWEASTCSKEFGYPPELSETLLGLLPLNTLVARRLIYQLRSWIEPCQSFEKNILGLGRMFLNSLRLTWTMSLLADAAGLLRALALLNSPRENNLLRDLIPTQMGWSWENLGKPENKPTPISTNKIKD